MHFSQPDEERLFSERHSKLLELLPDLNDTLDHVFKHTVMGDRASLTVFMLGRRCANDFSEILLLASNSFGFASLQLLRGMFEKLVDARYLHDHTEEVDSFWDYHLVLLGKLGYQDIAAKFDPDWNTTVAKFKQPKKKGFRPRWNKLTLVDEAKQVGFGDLLHGAYYLPNAFIHNSAAEILFSLEADENGRFTPKDFNNPDERRAADLAVQQAIFLLIEVLKLQIQHYGWHDSAPLLEGFIHDYGTYLKSINSV